MTERKPRKSRRDYGCLLWGSLALLSCGSCLVRSPPDWWKAGRPRRRPGSLAEAELLSHLAVLLLPEEPIAELFRDFPAQKSEGWGSNTLSPDMALYGALESEEAALFLEYDGFYRHQKPTGIAADSRKNTALLDLAPNGSYVLRIAHADRGLELSCEMGEVVVDSWRPGDDSSLVQALLHVAEFLLKELGVVMHPDRRASLQNFVDDPGGSSRQAAVEFTETVAAQRDCDFDPTRLLEFLQMQLDVSISEAEELAGKCPALARRDIDKKLKPMMQQLEVWGLKKAQVAKVLARYPQVLGYSIEEKLKPTVHWLRDLGLKKVEVTNVIVRSPQNLGLSIEENLKPTVQWLRDLGITEVEVAKVAGRFPQVLGLSIEENLKPTVQWLRDLGLKKVEVAKVIAGFPQVSGYSIEENLKPTAQWLRDLGLTKAEVAKVVPRRPQVLGLSIEENLKPTVQWLRDLGLTKAEVARVIARHPQLLGYSVEGNLKPTVQFLRDLGLKQNEVAKVIARFAPILWLSIEANLKPKGRLLLEWFSSEKIRHLLVHHPCIVCLKRERWVRRHQLLQACGKLSAFVSAMKMTDADFAKRYTRTDSKIMQQVKTQQQALQGLLLNTSQPSNLLCDPVILRKSFYYFRVKAPLWEELAQDRREADQPSLPRRLQPEHEGRREQKATESLRVASVGPPGIGPVFLQFVRSPQPGSLAEAELLSHLAVLLLPSEPIEELFRDFPVQKSEGWGSNTLSPDLAVYGALESEEAALFVEYDGYYRHLKPAGIAADSRKNTALLDLAPNGSYVLRIAHADRGLEVSCEMGEVVVDSWRPGDDSSLVQALLQVAEFLLKQLGTSMHPARRTSLESFVDDPGGSSRQAAVEFTEKVAVEREGDIDPTQLHNFLRMQLGVSISQAEELVVKCPALARHDIDDKLKPMMQQLEVWGLEKSEVATVLARHPQVLGYSIEENLKPTVQWLRDLGLTKAEVAKVIARYPQLLGYSVEGNLKPTVQWLRDLGLTKAEVAKVIARHPQVLGLSIEGNLKPTVLWLRDLGLTKAEVAKVIARYPQLLGYSVEGNLKPTVQWLRDLGLTKAEVAKVIARHPQVLGLSIEGNLKPTVLWLRDLGLTKAEVAKVIARYPQLLGYSVEGNLKPTVQWLRDLGLTKAEVAKVIARHPQVLGLSIEGNLKPTVQWLRDLGLKKVEVAKVIAGFPQVSGYSIEENLKPTAQWLRDLGLTKAEVAKVVPRRPQVLGLSIEENLQPTVQWLWEVGLTKDKVAKVIARFPPVLGYSIEQNLKPTVQWLRDLGLKKAAIAKVIVRHPQFLGLSIEENLQPTVQWLREVGLTKDEVAKVNARFAAILWLSIEENLKPKVQWLRDLGLTKSDVARIISSSPTILACSLERNLKSKGCLLLEWFSSEKVRHLLVHYPCILTLRRERWIRRSQVLQACDKLSVLGSAMIMTDTAFAKRFDNRMQDQLVQRR
ncbi:MTERF5 [Symbiodinium sp. CCMP2592]|nr:MTERF5 [Symbiodinium sp. CCMP2592]